MTNIAWMLDRASELHPDKVAIVDPSGEKYTYREFDEYSNQIGNYLSTECGIGEGDIVAGLLPDSFWTAALLFGAMKIGAVSTLENWTLKYDVIRQNVENTEAKVAVVDGTRFESPDQLTDDVDAIDTLVRYDEGGNGPSFKDAISEHSTELSITPQTRDDLAIINYTSGTTGQPKGVMLTHGTLSSSVRAIRDAYHGILPSDRLLLFLPMYHTGGISSTLFATSAGATHIIAGGWDADRVIELTRQYDPTWYTYIVPTMVRDLMSHEAWDSLDFSGIKAYIAGEPVPAEIQEALQEKGIRVSGTYGMTETMPLAVTISPIAQDADKDMPAGAVGKPARELGEMKIIDLTSGDRIEEPGVEGEVCFRGDNLSPGYYNDETRTRRAFDEDGWFHTDDLGYLDEDGYLYITGRADDMILSGGEKLSLVELDDVLVQHDLVKDGGTVGVPHERFGEAPAALVVPSDQNITEEALMAELDTYMQEELANWKRPRLYAIVDEIPRTPAKQTKIAPKLASKLPDDIELSREVSVTTLSELRKRRA